MSIIYLDNILIASIFNGMCCLLIKIHGMSSIEKNVIQRGGRTSRITKKESGSN